MTATPHPDRIRTSGLDLWLARGAVACVAGLQLLAFTNATALSPTDTLPLTARATLPMMAEAMVSLVTVTLVAARAVNISA